MEHVVALDRLSQEGGPARHADRNGHIDPGMQVNVRLVAQALWAEHRNVAVQTECPLGKGEAAGMATDIGGGMEDSRAVPRRSLGGLHCGGCTPEALRKGDARA